MVVNETSPFSQMEFFHQLEAEPQGSEGFISELFG